MRRLIAAMFVLGCLAPVPFMVGCDDTVEQRKTTEIKDDGTKVTTEKKVTESPSGTITKTQEKTVDR